MSSGSLVAAGLPRCRHIGDCCADGCRESFRGRSGRSARFERHDLALTFPAGHFDLVTALYFQSPVEFPRAEVLRTATGAVVRGGHFLLVEHAVAAPWSFRGTTPFSTVEETYAFLHLDADWETLWMGSPPRHVTGPDQQVAEVLDNVFFLKKV